MTLVMLGFFDFSGFFFSFWFLGVFWWTLGAAELLGNLRPLCWQGAAANKKGQQFKKQEGWPKMLGHTRPPIEVMGVQCRPEGQEGSLVAAMHPSCSLSPIFRFPLVGSQAITKNEEQFKKELKTTAALGKHLRSVKWRACVWLDGFSTSLNVYL